MCIVFRHTFGAYYKQLWLSLIDLTKRQQSATEISRKKNSAQEYEQVVNSATLNYKQIVHIFKEAVKIVQDTVSDIYMYNPFVKTSDT